jgi:3-dehydroquinate dehydratase/shikimate dehydrogenase
MALVCETVTADSMADLIAARDAAHGADLVELRLDGVRDVDLAGALAGRRCPVVVTCRPVWEGGRFDGAEEVRLRLLADACARGAEYVDVEWRADRRSLLSEYASRLVLSHHDFKGVPQDLADRVRAMRAEATGLVKVAVTATRLADCVALRRAVGDGGSHIAIAMGSAGRLTRAWPAWTGSRWMYSGSAAPGQISTRDLVEVYRVRDTTSRTTPFGIVGSPLGHSASPAMHNAAFSGLGLDNVYVPFETADADEFLEVAAAIGLAGASVTAPLKGALAARCVSTDDVTASVGAVNTLKRSGAGWEGRNFDVAGFLAPIDRLGAAPSGSHALILGAGGAARAAAWALRQRGVEVAIAARRGDAARRVAEAVGVGVAPWPSGPLQVRPGLLVIATPVGAWPAVGVSPVDAPAADVAYDLVYNPIETTFLTRARAAGARTIGGIDMLVEQAARQFEWWTDRAVPRPMLDRAARRFLGFLGTLGS